jgi:hypothetical protein
MKLAIVLLVVITAMLGMTSGSVVLAKHHGSHHPSSSTSSTTNVPANTQSMICTTTTTPGNETITLTGGLPADVSCPVIQSGVHVLYMHWYYSPGWLNLRGAFQTNSNEIDISTVLYDNNHQVMDTPPKQYITLTTNSNGIKSFDDPIVSTGELVGAATYQLQGVFVVTP